MKFFHLPDLGEGIPEADIVEWHVSKGDKVKEDQIIISVETAKAVVEVPSPITGVIANLCGLPGDTILTGEPLVEFVSDKEDTGTVVGKLEQASHDIVEEESFIIGSPSNKKKTSENVSSSSGLAALANKLNIKINQTDVKESQVSHYKLKKPSPLKGVRKHMARLMAKSHAEVAAVTLFDDADIHYWKEKEDITVRIIKAIVSAYKEEPALNAWFDFATMSREIHTSLDLGLAVDSSDGLFVPVIRGADSLSAEEIRSAINSLREGVNNRSIAQEDLHGATITLSNFGVFAGSYATPIVVPPTVCIIGVGQLRERFISIENSPESHRTLPLSLSFDHRAVTGGEATRFLRSMIKCLEKTEKTM